MADCDVYCSALAHRATWKLDHTSLVHEELDALYAEAQDYLLEVVMINNQAEVDDVPPHRAAAATASLLYLEKYSNVNVDAILKRMELARTPMHRSSSPRPKGLHSPRSGGQVATSPVVAGRL